MYIFGYFFQKGTFKGSIEKKGTLTENFGGRLSPCFSERKKLHNKLLFQKMKIVI